MNIRDFLKLHPAVDDKGFGQFVEQRRLELGITLREFAEMSTISTTYLFDIEKGQRYAPLNYLDVYSEILKINKEDNDLFLDLAYSTRKNHPDINEYICQTPKAREFLRLAKRLNLSDEELSSIILSLPKANQKPVIYEEEEPVV